jgi:site-specific recombinase XerD
MTINNHDHCEPRVHSWISDTAGMGRVSMHLLRYTFVKRLVGSGVDIDSILAIAGSRGRGH